MIVRKRQIYAFRDLMEKKLIKIIDNYFHVEKNRQANHRHVRLNFDGAGGSRIRPSQTPQYNTQTRRRDDLSAG